jgi:hypothetical protein
MHAIKEQPMSQALRALCTVAVALAVALPVSAQQGNSQSGPVAVTATSASTVFAPNPVMGSLMLAPSASREAFGVPAAALRAPSSQNVAMIVVGGAGLLVGAVIGGDAGTIIMIGGGGLGLLGLYRYLS